MFIQLRKPAVLGLSAMGLVLGMAYTAKALPTLPVQNLTFSTFSGAETPKGNFSEVNPANWFRGTPAGNSDLVFIDAPGTATTVGADASDNPYAVYGPFADPPPGGNFVQADGNPTFESTFGQTITGLTSGQHYTLSFWQAAGQQQNFTGATTEQWKVFFGSSGSVNVDCTNSPCVASSTDAEVDSTLMNTPSQGVSPWNLVTMNLTATGTSDVLTFLAWGDGGSTTNEPPTVFLAGVNSPALTPEPASLSLMAAGLLGLGGIARRRRAKRNAS